MKHPILLLVSIALIAFSCKKSGDVADPAPATQPVTNTTNSPTKDSVKAPNTFDTAFYPYYITKPGLIIIGGKRYYMTELNSRSSGTIGGGTFNFENEGSLVIEIEGKKSVTGELLGRYWMTNYGNYANYGNYEIAVMVSDRHSRFTSIPNGVDSLDVRSNGDGILVVAPHISFIKDGNYDSLLSGMIYYWFDN